jgi:hypothetical protein
MLTHRVEGVPALERDEELVAAVMPTAGFGQGGHGRIGIAGPDGRVYRVFLTTSPLEHEGLRRVLRGLGLDQVGGRDGYDCVFAES